MKKLMAVLCSMAILSCIVVSPVHAAESSDVEKAEIISVDESNLPGREVDFAQGLFGEIQVCSCTVQKSRQFSCAEAKHKFLIHIHCDSPILCVTHLF